MELSKRMQSNFGDWSCIRQVRILFLLFAMPIVPGCPPYRPTYQEWSIASICEPQKVSAIHIGYDDGDKYAPLKTVSDPTEVKRILDMIQGDRRPAGIVPAIGGLKFTFHSEKSKLLSCYVYDDVIRIISQKGNSASRTNGTYLCLSERCARDLKKYIDEHIVIPKNDPPQREDGAW